MKLRKCCSDHPVITALVAVFIVAAITIAIVAIVKMVKREEELLEEEWELEEDEPLYFCPTENDFAEAE